MTTAQHSQAAGSREENGLHEHCWHTESSHLTSTGIVEYLQCRRCRRRIMRQRGFAEEQTLLSKELQA
ncbi:MAG TPA: hypothetical protein DIT09_01165 [Glutamicibacter sp.]|jgi:hypothetical protein|uniref:Uncharacterized protein n=1 Tax=Glutamicibacter arilaitensis TaxID=256701 RepID=A0A4Y8TUJ6_9MICC|nr:hypothetical protein [Glutamicibacter arilaitensis]TFH54970.1 hypothetical protein EXY26_13455 [Glutamicibacter arilaitensis]HCM93246.1 hypothetical protein [Glutamicibacter sp.]